MAQDLLVAERLEARIAERLPQLLLDVRDRLLTGWPDYAAFLDEDLEEIRDGAGLFLHRLMVLATSGLNDGARPLEDEQAVQVVFQQIGGRQWELGHDLTRLLTAYQVGARVAWRHVAECASAMDLPGDLIAGLAESVFDFVNHLSQASTQGYVQAQRADARARDRQRADLVDLLLSERSTMSAVRAAADRARWRLPARVALLLGDDEGELLSRLDASTLPVRQGDLAGAIIADPIDRERLARTLRGVRCVIGLTVPVELAARSVELAQIAFGLARDGVLGGCPVFVDDHLDTIIVHRDDRLLAFLRDQVLAPLEGLPVGARERLTDTLVWWLRHQGDRTAVAQELHVHPQTVSYRVNRLRELFGDALDSPRERSRLLLALNWS
ncbi:helix-turn-helix domain-containing protein [Nocardioides sp. DS6]|uniref:Helix-turn-helix domain-containing protein n=1 Tax=Nocardioides eburneus TaxID=3231482 RepID=A0ABV3T0C3_9ACTN